MSDNNNTEHAPRPGRVVDPSETESAPRPGARQQSVDRDVSPLYSLPAGSQILDRFTVIETLRSHERAHNGVFICEDDGCKVVVKVAATGHTPDPEIWRKLKDLQHPNVLRTLDTAQSEGLYYEIQEYCSGGSLEDDIRERDLQKTGLPSEGETVALIEGINHAINYLHSHQIVHRDVKPANIYWRVEPDGSRTPVLGDFDISSLLETGETSRSTERAAATWFYCAPESLAMYCYNTRLPFSLISHECDFYSFGITLIEVLSGTTGLPGGQIEISRFYLDDRRVAVPQSPVRFSELIRGLVIRDREKRWGYGEICRWLLNKTTKQDRERIAFDLGYKVTGRAQVPISFGTRESYTLRELAQAVLDCPEIAKEDLLSGRIERWVEGLDTNTGRSIGVASHKHKNNPDFALFVVSMLCDPVQPFRLVFSGSASDQIEWLKSVARSGHVIDSVSNSELAKLEHWIGIRNFDIASEVDIFRLAMAAVDPLLRFEILAYGLDRKYRFHPAIPAHLNYRTEKLQGGKSPKAIGRAGFGTSEDWETGTPKEFEFAAVRTKAGYLDAWLLVHGHEELVRRARARITGLELLAQHDLYLRQLWPDAPKPTVTLDTSAIASTITIPYRSKREFQISWATTGVGIPVGKLQIVNDRTLLSLNQGQSGRDAYAIQARTGYKTLYVDATSGDVLGLGVTTALITTEGGNFLFAPPEYPVAYEVVRPHAAALLRVCLGAVAGALVFGSLRGLISTVLPKPVNQAGPNMDLDTIFAKTVGGEFSYGGKYIIALLIIVAFGIGIYYAFLEVLKKSEP